MKTATHNTLARALAFLNQLDEALISYRLEHVRDSLMVVVAVPGERWEIEFFSDDRVEVERFTSAGSIEGQKALDELFAMYSD